MNIDDSAAVVTGGCSGLGLATARGLLDRGASVVILDLPSSSGEEAAEQLGTRARFWPGDVTDTDSVSQAFDLAQSLGPRAHRRQLCRHG